MIPVTSKCNGFTKQGTPCKVNVSPGTNYCKRCVLVIEAQEKMKVEKQRQQLVNPTKAYMNGCTMACNDKIDEEIARLQQLKDGLKMKTKDRDTVIEAYLQHNGRYSLESIVCTYFKHKNPLLFEIMPDISHALEGAITSISYYMTNMLNYHSVQQDAVNNNNTDDDDDDGTGLLIGT